jgi:hypothetical protein
MSSKTRSTSTSTLKMSAGEWEPLLLELYRVGYVVLKIIG